MKDWQTRLLHSDTRVPENYESLAVPTYRGSTTVFPSAGVANDAWDQWSAGYTYGLYGTPTTLELAGRICELESGFRTILTSGGQLALTLVNLAFLRSGDHLLLPDTVYTPHRVLTSRVLGRLGIRTSFYDAQAGSHITKWFEPETRLVWVESPGSITMEIQDVPAIVEVARSHGILVAMDNTWAAGIYFKPFAHGVDISVQALTKYVGGHSDLLMGAVTVREQKLYETLGSTSQALGGGISPDDCSLALRGLQTLAVRLSAIETSALTIAKWLTARPEVEQVLHPALASCPSHEMWKRDFTGSSGVFSFVLRDGVSKERVHSAVDALQLFRIGYSWAGTTSVVMTYDFGSVGPRARYGHRLIRLSVGLESTNDLINDLEKAFIQLRS